GQSFQGIPGPSMSKILINPSNTSMLYVSANSGLYRSTDGANTFQVLAPNTWTDVAIDPSNSNIVYGAAGFIFGDNTHNGIFKATDGFTFGKLGGGLPTTNVGRISLAMAPSAPLTLYRAIQDASAANFGALLGIWKTTDGGNSWTQLSATGASCASQCWYDMYVAVDPTNANTVYFGGFSIYKSTDGGATFSNIGSSIHVDQHALAFQP